MKEVEASCARAYVAILAARARPAEKTNAQLLLPLLEIGQVNWKVRTLLQNPEGRTEMR